VDEKDRWTEYCKPAMDDMRKDHQKLKDKVDDIHTIVTNGLQNNVKANREDIKALDNKVWYIMSGVIVSILLQIVLRLL